MKIEILLAKENHDLIKESNYFEQLELDTNQVWQGEITNFFVVFKILLQIVGISNLNDNLHLKEVSLCVHASFTCETHQQQG